MLLTCAYIAGYLFVTTPTATFNLANVNIIVENGTSAKIVFNNTYNDTKIEVPEGQTATQMIADCAVAAEITHE